VLGRLSPNNSQGEYYLTDTMRLLARQAGSRAAVRCAPDYRTLLGINTPAQLAEAERIHRELEGAGAPEDGGVVTPRRTERLWAPWRMQYIRTAEKTAAAACSAWSRRAGRTGRTWCSSAGRMRC
jgi:bifunctional N-acetylglucosamine-1-phosphate-uridyltransferase/glucosamine-1-phosphate-acetyltransferase GlmU-like protein